MKIWWAEVEDKNDPYGGGPGYRIWVLAKTKYSAVKKVKQHVAKMLPDYMVCKVRLATAEESLHLVY